MNAERPGKLGLRLAQQYGLEDAPLCRDVIASEAFKGRRAGLCQSQAHGTARRLLAGQLGVPSRRIPSSPGRAQAIGQYEYRRRRDFGWFGLPSTFDSDSMRFAFENQVCPRCMTAGTFGEDEGRCGCGFMYQDGSVSHAPAEVVPHRAVE